MGNSTDFNVSVGSLTRNEKYILASLVWGSEMDSVLEQVKNGSDILEIVEGSWDLDELEYAIYSSTYYIGKIHPEAEIYASGTYWNTSTDELFYRGVRSVGDNLIFKDINRTFLPNYCPSCDEELEAVGNICVSEMSDEDIDNFVIVCPECGEEIHLKDYVYDVYTYGRTKEEDQDGSYDEEIEEAIENVKAYLE